MRTCVRARISDTYPLCSDCQLAEPNNREDYTVLQHLHMSILSIDMTDC